MIGHWTSPRINGIPSANRGRLLCDPDASPSLWRRTEICIQGRHLRNTDGQELLPTRPNHERIISILYPTADARQCSRFAA